MVTLILAIPANAAPGTHFQGSGDVWVDDGVSCPTTLHEGHVLVLVERMTDGYYATAVLLTACNPVFYGLESSAGVVYKLEGDWATGFSGAKASRLYPCHYELRIGPYGDGASIPAWGFMDCGATSLSVYWTGTIRDLQAL